MTAQTESATVLFGEVPEAVLTEKGPWMVEQKGNGPLQRVKPFTMEVRAEVDNELSRPALTQNRHRSA
jgi:hypothetical protein